MRDVEGKVAFITGGASGIGWGMARAFMDAGMKVVVADLLQQHLDEVAAQHPGANNLHLIRLDVTDRPAMEAVLTIWPPSPCFLIRGRKLTRPLAVPITLTPMT